MLLSILSLPLATRADSPEAVCEQYIRSLSSDGAAAVVKFMHPAEIERFKQMFLPVLRVEAEQGRSTVRSATFGKGATIAEIEATPAGEFMKAVFRLAPINVADPVKIDRVDILGAIPEGDAVHLLARIHIGAGEFTLKKLEVVTMIPYEKSWRLALTAQMEGLASALRAQSSPAKAEPALPAPK